jgi:diguanylate cyclase (GGDEF)-like protein
LGAAAANYDSVLLAAFAATVTVLGFVAGLLVAHRRRRRRLDTVLDRVDLELAAVSSIVRHAADRADQRRARRSGDQALAPNLERLLERIAAEGAPVHALRRFASELKGELGDTRRLPRAKQPASRDELTGVRDRNGYEAELEREIARAQRSGEPLALVLLDLGDLAERRIRSGHADVDRLLQDFAALLVGTTRLTDTVCRRGRDEFGILLPGTDATGARHFRRRLRDGAAQADFGLLGPLTFSSGIVEWRRGESRDVLDARARIAVGRTRTQPRESQGAEGDDLLGEPHVV